MRDAVGFEVEQDGRIESRHRIDLLGEQHGIAQLRAELADLDPAGIEPGDVGDCGKHARGRIRRALAQDAAVQIGELGDPAALERDHRLRRAVVKNEHRPGRDLGAARGEFDQRRNVANADVGRLARGPGDRVGRTFRRLDRHVEPELAEISALERVVETGRAAVGGKIQHHADLGRTLCLGSDRQCMEQRKCPERQGRPYDRLHGCSQVPRQWAR